MQKVRYSGAFRKLPSCNYDLDVNMNIIYKSETGNSSVINKSLDTHRKQVWLQVEGLKKPETEKKKCGKFLSKSVFKSCENKSCSTRLFPEQSLLNFLI